MPKEIHVEESVTSQEDELPVELLGPGMGLVTAVLMHSSLGQLFLPELMAARALSSFTEL